MSKDTWNFPTWLCRDRGPSLSPRADRGHNFTAQSQTLPFSSSITCVFSFLARSGHTAEANEQTYLTTIAKQSGAHTALSLRLNMDTSTPENSKLRVRFYDIPGAVERYNQHLGDENGTDWLHFDKWYQVVISANATRLQFAVNGSTTPTTTLVTSTPGSLNLDDGSERWWHFGPPANSGSANPILLTDEWPSCMVGASAWDAPALDLTDQAVLDRIYDSDGDFKNPGENGSLWFNDSYTTAANFSPDVYMWDGSGRKDNGSASLTWIAFNSSGITSAPGGLRKFYE